MRVKRGTYQQKHRYTSYELVMGSGGVVVVMLDG